MQDKTIVCLKYGSKYSSEYVNKLYSMTERYCSYEHDFVCLTEDVSDLNKNIRTISLQTYDDIKGWWYKTFLFDPALRLGKQVLFLDLDVVVFNEINKFFDYEKDSTFCISRGFRKDNKKGMNSSCFRFNPGTHSHIYFDFMKNRETIMKRLHGDQDWLQEQIDKFEFWPEEWLMSYKWDMMKGQNRNPTYTHNTSIAVFHGEPKPHQITDNWCKENWK